MENRNIILRSKMNLRILLVFSVMLLSFVVVNDTFASSYTLTLTSSGSQTINMSSSAGTAISSDAINVATTCRYGYNFTINTSVSDNNLYLGGDSSNNTAGTYFEPTDGTSALNATTNMWGYYYNASSTPTSASVFSPVPILSNPATVKTPLTTPSSSDINDNFNIYYGVSSSPTMAKGTYKMIPDTNNSNNDGTIVYTATIADACTRYTVHFSPTSEFEGNTLSGTGTMNDQTIYEGVATTLTSNGFTAPTGYYFAGWNTVQDGSGTQYTNGQQVTDLTTPGNTITLYAMWTDCPAKRICYSPNVSNPSDVEGEMENKIITSLTTTVRLYAPNYSRTNYGFAAWNTKPDGTGINYGPQADIEFTAGAYNTGGLKLYAKWVASAGNMQSWTGCSSMNIGDVTALTDIRDNDVYAVAKLADGKCWMIENLRLDNTASHNSDGSLAQGYDSSFIGLADPESANFNDNGVANSLYSTDGSTDATISGSFAGYYFPRYNNNNTSSRQTSSNYSTSGNTYSYGNYYTWSSAIADTTHHDTSNQSITTTSLCPTGWHLPKGGNKNNEANNEYWALVVTGLNNGIKPANYDSLLSPAYIDIAEAGPVDNALRSYPNNFLYSGLFDLSGASNRNSSGFYWSSTSGSSNAYSYFLSIYNNNVVPGTSSYYRYRAGSIRCIAGT